MSHGSPCTTGHAAPQEALERRLESELAEIRTAGLWRELRRVDSAQGRRIRVGNREVLNFSSNDYLGLANHVVLREAAIKAIEKFGCGSGASRLVCGSLSPHHQFEESIAAFTGSEAALAFNSGHAAALGAIGALMGSHDVVVIDRLAHASLVDAVRLSGARLLVFPHNDLDGLERVLRRRDCQGAVRRPRVLVVTESVFSMDGDRAPLGEIVEIKDRFGAWLMVDEAHATGLFGDRRSGLGEQPGLGDRIEIRMATLGKALGSSGGCICGSRKLVDLLVNRARSFIFTTAPVPAASAAASAAIEIVQSDEGARRHHRLWQNVAGMAELLTDVTTSPANGASAIFPIVVGSESVAMKAASNLFERGVLAPGIRFPTVARGAARLRVSLTSDHTHDDLGLLARALREILANAG